MYSCHIDLQLKMLLTVEIVSLNKVTRVGIENFKAINGTDPINEVGLFEDNMPAKTTNYMSHSTIMRSNGLTIEVLGILV